MSVSENSIEIPVETCSPGLSRRSFFEHATLASTATALGLFGLAGTVRAFADQPNPGHDHIKGANATSSDVDILSAAAIAEALAVATYTGIVRDSGWFTRIPDDDQGYFHAAREEEMSHYLLASSATGKDSPFTTFYYPKGMFSNAQVSLNTLVSLEDAFIAAYLVGVRYFSTADLRVTAARIMGIESDHRTLARAVSGDVATQDGGPIKRITGLQGVPEKVDPPNNNGYERTLCLTNISQAVTALLPFVDKAHAHAAGFDIDRPRTFEPFNPHLATPLGDFFSLTGC
jgi:hypothetical protein